MMMEMKWSDIMESEEIIDMLESLKICREFEKRNNLKLFTKRYDKIRENLENKLEKENKVNLEDRVGNLEQKLSKIDQKLENLKKS